MKVVYSDKQKKHDPKSFFASGASLPNPEVPERAERLLAAARDSGLQHEQPDDHGIAPIAAVHSDRYIRYLQQIYTRWSRIEGAGVIDLPDVSVEPRCG